MRYLVHTAHRDAFEVTADEILIDDRYVIFLNRNDGKDDEVVASVRFDHFKSAVKMETIH